MLTEDNIVSVKKINDEAGILCNHRVVWDTDKICCVPNATENTDYQAILEWEAIDGNTIAEAD
tara:strand:- start:521 stop:709 length:189 start_codon:yes stop_codon:yes gene_type:complete